MNFRLLSATMAAALVFASPIDAQTRGDESVPSLQELTGSLAAARRTYENLCTGERVRVSLPDDPQTTYHFAAELEPFGGYVLCDDARQLGQAVAVQSTDQALGLLAFKPFAPLWPQAEARWGVGLSILRDEIVANDGRVGDPRYGRMMDEANRRAFARAPMLMSVGRTVDAFREIDALQKALSERRNARRERLAFDRAMVMTRRAGMLADLGRRDEAADSLAAYLPAMGKEDPYRANIVVNLAAYLAETGRHAEALALIEPAYADFRASQPAGQAYRISGSDREFAWIHACALAGLGREADAARYVSMIRTADQQPWDRYVPSPKRTSAIALRMYRCMDDEAGWFGVFDERELTLPLGEWIRLQPAYARADGMRQGWTVPADIRARYDALYRTLPPAYDPALNQWRQRGPAVSSTE